MSVIDDLIFDRTQSDSSYLQSLRSTILTNGWDSLSADEKNEWLTLDATRGAYNISDLNRVGQALNYVKAELNNQGYNLQWTATTTWSRNNVPSQSDMTAYLSYVTDIHNAIQTSTLPNVPPDMADLTIGEANDIEEILYRVWDFIIAMKKAYYYCNDLYCGEVNG